MSCKFYLIPKFFRHEIMWAEARKHEKRIRGIVIDLRKRAERRKAYYDAIKDDPVSYLRIHGNNVSSRKK
jgi:hypothetical protein